jgi:hypothetical protein
MGRSTSAADIPVHVLAIELNLTSAQKSKIETIENDVDTQRRSMFSAGNRPDPQSMGAMFQKMRTLNETASAKVEAVLTPTQRQSLKPLLASIGSVRSVGIPVELYSDLKLSSAQKSQIDGLAASNRQAMQAAFSQGQGGGDFDAMRTRMQSMRTHTDARLKKILTAHQYTLIEQYRKKHPRRGFGGPGRGFGGPGMPPPGGFGGPRDGRGPGFGGGGNPGDRQSADNGNNAPDDNPGPPPPGDNMGPPPGGGGGDDMPPPPGDNGGGDMPPPPGE